MKVLYLEAKRKNSANQSINHVFTKKALKILPKSLFIAYSIQYESLAKQIKHFLEANSYYIYGFKQVLGCTTLKNLKINSPILLIGSGRFHALNLALQTFFPVYLFNNGDISILSKEDVDKLKARKKTAFLKFLNAEKIGILVSTKSGQYNLDKSIKLKEKLEKKNKKVYLFISDNLNLSELENFQIDSWVNTACPGLALDNSLILNLRDIEKAVY